MAKYDVTYSCGHDGIIGLVGSGKTREWRLEQEGYKMCPDCYQKHIEKEREQANIAAAEAAKEMELPELTGTEKQVAWANTLRQQLILKFEKKVAYLEEHFAGREGIKESLESLHGILSFVIETKTTASWYIDRRSQDLEEIFRAEDKAYKESIQDATPEGQAVKEEKAIDLTVYPSECKFKVPAEIFVKDDKIKVSFEKNDTFRDIVKALNYTWGNGCWYRDLDFSTGSVADRAAELGNKLLNAGFPITIMDKDILQNAIDGKYEPECSRWVYLRTKGEHEGKLAINWGKERNDTLYAAARKLPGSKWANPSVMVRVEHYQEVQDFANLFGFKFSKGAVKAIEAEKAKKKTVVNPASVEAKVEKDGLKDILNSSEEVLDDLKD